MAIRPSIYIGLGGTGLTAVSYAKKLYEQAYKGVDNIPGQIAFAAVDFDLAAPEDPNLATDMHDDFLSFQMWRPQVRKLFMMSGVRGEILHGCFPPIPAISVTVSAMVPVRSVLMDVFLPR